jgi:predicted anti-sigma-YlaC factor YlaD
MRALISYRLDVPGSQFERALVAAHLRGCAECSAFGAEVGAFTALIRDAPLEQMPRQVSLPRAARYRRPLRVARGALATAAVAVAAVGIGGSAQLDGAADIFRTAAPAPGDANQIVSIRQLRREDLSQGRLAILPLPDGSLGAVKPVLRVANL